MRKMKTIKERKEEKARQADLQIRKEKRDKERAILNARKEMEQREADLKTQQQQWIKYGKEAIAAGIKRNIDLARNGIKMTQAEYQRAQSMRLNMESILLNKSMLESTNKFIKIVNMISTDILDLTPEDALESQIKMDQALQIVSNQISELENMLDTSQGSNTVADINPQTDLDAFADGLLYGDTASDTLMGNTDMSVEALRKKIDGLK